MYSLKIRSGVFAATSSMSMPPSGLAIRIGRAAPRSRISARYSSRAMPSPSSTKHAGHDAAFGSGLVRLQRHADHVERDPLGLVGVLRQLHAAALAAAAGMNLRLDDDGAAAEAAGDLGGFGGREGDLALRERARRTREDGLGLVFVDFHGCPGLLMDVGTWNVGA